MAGRRGVVLGIAALAAVLLLGRALAGQYADYRWYAALGAASLWRTQTSVSLALRFASGITAAVFVFANLYAVRHSVVSLVLPRRLGDLEIGEEIPGSYLVAAAAILAVILGALLTLPSQSWMSWVLSRHGVPFSESDPYFEADLSYYVYWLPFEAALYSWALLSVIVVIAVVVFLYALTPSLRFDRHTLYVSHYVRRHLVVLGCLLMLLMAWSDRLDAYRVLVNGSGPDGLFTFTDHRAVIPVNLWLSIITVAASFVVLFFGWTGQLRVAVAALGTLLIIALGARELSPSVARHFAPIADAALRERPYRQVRIDYTRRAYALDRVRGPDSLGIAGPVALTRAVSLWDRAPLLHALGRTHRIDGVVRGFGYMPTPAGIDALIVAGPADDNVIAGDTDDQSSGPPAMPWTALHIPVAAAGDSGLPIATAASVAAFPAALVYDSLAGYLVVRDTANTIAAPDLGTGLSRLAHAWSLQNFRLLSLDDPHVHLRVLTRRAVRDRVGALAPFFTAGTTVLPVVADDSIYWVLELYDATNAYPLSEHMTLGDREVSAAQHAATAIVNAHTGRVTLVLAPSPDPTAQSWARLFPSLFTHADDLAPALRAALPPAIDGARLQAAVLARFGVRGDTAPLGHLPWNAGADSVSADDLAPLETARGALAWSTPVLDSSDRFAGIFIAVGGDPPSAHWLPFAAAGPRWNSVLDDMRHALDTASGAARDTRLARGVVRAVPLAGPTGTSAELVQPAFEWRGDAPPALVRVAVSRDTVVRTGRTLAAALGIAPPAETDTIPTDAAGFRRRAAELYARMRDAQRRGDWAAFGRAYDALGRLLAPSVSRP